MKHQGKILAVAVAAAVAVVPISYGEWWPGSSTDPSVTLNGDNPIRVVQGGSFTDPGATCVDGSDVSTIYASESVDTSETGTTVLNYTCGGEPDAAVAIRSVIVYNTPPSMTLTHTELTLDVASVTDTEISQLGPSCTDAQDGTLTYTTSTSTTSDDTTSTTTITFTCTDTDGLTDTATGTIHH